MSFTSFTWFLSLTLYQHRAEHFDPHRWICRRSYLPVETRSRRYRMHASFGFWRIHSSRKHHYSFFCVPSNSPRSLSKRVVVLKDQQNKKAHEQSAQIACEAAASIRTVASLTREKDVLNIYSTSLEEPLRRSNRVAVWSNLIFSVSQAMTMFVVALVFWYGSRGVSKLEYGTTAFFVCVFVSDCFLYLRSQQSLTRHLL